MTSLPSRRAVVALNTVFSPNVSDQPLTKHQVAELFDLVEELAESRSDTMVELREQILLRLAVHLEDDSYFLVRVLNRAVPVGMAFRTAAAKLAKFFPLST